MDLSYPIGKYQFPDSTTATQRATWIEEIRQAPAAMRAAIRCVRWSGAIRLVITMLSISSGGKSTNGA